MATTLQASCFGLSIALTFAILRRIKNQNSFCCLDINHHTLLTSKQLLLEEENPIKNDAYILDEKDERKEAFDWLGSMQIVKDDTDLSHAINAEPFGLYG